ncbi:hypothetical protein SLEP1_g1396 [Rubroshorea leprosula]|uniref:Uncharacterized protein n=1 Tax=Rubroshorea leprosula TaxID=152421 RepID=A0AAV5HDM8_9ROSI|nr:hypothetical protein SLEP1_g1396 [Rubroshorea leprosula]
MNPSKRGFHNLSKVEELFLNNSILPTNFFHGIGALTSLKVLSLYGCRFNDSLTLEVDLEKLSRLHHLEELDLCGRINFSYNILSSLASLPSLKAVCLGYGVINMNPSKRGFHNLSKVEELFLQDYILPTNFFHGIGALTSLKVLSLYDCGLNDSLTLRGLCELTHLEELDVSNNYLGGALPSYCGAIPNFLYSQHDLEYLDFSHLNLTGEFPIWLLENNTRLKTLLLVNNSLSGPIELPAHSHESLEDLVISNNFLDGLFPMEIRASLPSLRNLYISKNSLTGSIPPSIGDIESLHSLDLSHNNLSGSIPPSIGDIELLLFLDLSYNNLSGSIPPSIGDMEFLQSLNLSHNNLSGGIPEKLTMGCSSLNLLILSNNNLQGQIFSEKFSLFDLDELQLNGNHFSGSIPKSLSNCDFLSSIDFSNNNLSGRIPSWMGNMFYLEEIIMSNNGLEGPIPIDFCQLQFLLILDLSNNNLSGSLPPCFGPGHILHVHLSKNRLEGSLIAQFCKSFSLVTLDLSDNQLSGNIPDCINMVGELSYLILKNNNLEGKIPFQLCKLQKLSLIDLSRNHLSGRIPSCLNLTTDELYNEDDSVAPTLGPLLPPTFKNTLSVGEPVHFTTKNMAYSYKGRLLTYMSGIDLSCNKLIGEIPYEIGHLSKIHVLNLSHNFLVGGIPSTFSNLKQIESLDLSYNNLSGKIPPELVELYFLSTFSVAYNNLSGKTPARIQQFATFDGSCYQGNPLLCGEPIKSCSTTSPPPMIQDGPTRGREDDGFIDMGVFYVSLIVSYIMALITIAAVLYINPYWRRAWFYYTERALFSIIPLQPRKRNHPSGKQNPFRFSWQFPSAFVLLLAGPTQVFLQRALPIRNITERKKRSPGVQLLVDGYIDKLRNYCPLDDVLIHSNPKNSWCFHSPFLDVKVQVDDEDMAVMNHIRSDDWHGLDIGYQRFPELVGDAGSNVGNYNSLKGC